MGLDNKSIGTPESPEQFPSQAEIKSIFEAVLKGREYKELRIVSDKDGVSLYEVEVSLENGEKIELNFQRAKNNYRDQTLPAGGRFSASIHATYFDKGGIPYTGEEVANYLDGKWEFVFHVAEAKA